MVLAISSDSQNRLLHSSKTGILNKLYTKSFTFYAQLIYNKKLCEYDSGENIYSTN